MGSNTPSGRATALEATVVALLALALYLPFLAIQYDTNGIIEAAAIESGELVNKNHILYRPVGLLIFRAAQGVGYSGSALLVLQTLNAVCGSIGVGLAFALFKSATRDRNAAVLGSLWLATSFTYWMFSTDVAYITLAAMFGLGALVCIVYGRSSTAVVFAGILASLSILAWQASLFLVPIMLVFLSSWRGPVFRRLMVLAMTIGLTAGTAYVFTAFALEGVMGPRALWTWFTHYSEGESLPLWGVWDASRIQTAALSAIRSIVPALLAIRPDEITRSVQLGQIAVDLALVATGLLVILAAWKARLHAFIFLLGYALFIPFIVWWDPFEPKWFLIPNVLLAGFLSCGLQPWLGRRPIAILIILSALTIAGTNFVTTIRPRHLHAGVDRSVAQCVADHIKTSDAVIAAEWGWPDYLAYLHSRSSWSLISATAGIESAERTSRVRGFIVSTQQAGGDVYIADPHSYSASHLLWLRAQTGVSLEDLLSLGGSPAFTCPDRTILKLPREN